MRHFYQAMERKGYVLNLGQNRKYLTIRTPDSAKPTRLKTLGENYTEEAIKWRILENKRFDRPQYIKSTVKHMTFAGSISKTRKITGFRALYLHYCYLLGKIPKKSTRQPLSPVMREELRHFRTLVRQVSLLAKNKIDTAEQLYDFMDGTKSKIEELTALRQQICTMLRRSSRPENYDELCRQRDALTAELKKLRTQLYSAAQDTASNLRERRTETGCIERNNTMTNIQKYKQKGIIPKAVLYARFSSDNQREESIEAQLRAIHEYCERNGIIVIREYCDRAKSATTDDRPEFLQMIADAKNGGFDFVIVHKLDRFSRNRYDSAHYKKELKKCNVAVLSVLENLDDSPESVILESVLEGMSEYYSKNLAREVMKGMKESALQCRPLGGKPPYGYQINPQTCRYEVKESEAQAVKLIFSRVV